MTDPYRVEIRTTWHDGVSRDQAGPKHQTHLVNAKDIDDALSAAKLIVRGIRMNPAVWLAEVLTVSALRDDHTVVETEIPLPVPTPSALAQEAGAPTTPHALGRP